MNNSNVADPQGKITGSVTDKSLASLMHELYAAKASGQLEVVQEESNKQIFFLDGSPVYVDSNALEETLGCYLVNEGLLSDEDRQDFLLRAVGTGKDLGITLIESARLAPTVLFQQLRKNFEAKILDCFSWQKATFTFNPLMSLPSNVLTLKIDTNHIIFNGVENAMDLAEVERHLRVMPDDRFSPTGHELHHITEMDLGSDYDHLLRLLRQGPDFKTLMASFSGKAGWLKRALLSLWVTKIIDRQAVGDQSSGTVEIRGMEQFAKDDADRRKGDEEAPQVHADDLESRLNLLTDKYLRIRSQSFFELFEVDWSASDDEIRSAFLDFIKRYQTFDLDSTTYADAHGKSAEMLVEAARALVVLTLPELRKKYFQRIVERSKQNEQTVEEAEQSFRAGFQFLREQNHEAAVEMFQMAHQLDTKKPVYGAFVGFSLYLLDPQANFDRGYRMVQEALKTDEKSEALRLLEIRLLKKASRYEHALERANIALSQLGESPALREELGLIEKELQRQD